jgi:hypothetical protein
MRKLIALCMAAGLSAVTAAGEVRAQAPDAAATGPPVVPPAAAPADGWEFSATAYAWASGLEGDVKAFPALPSVAVDLSFGDVVENLDFAGMVLLQAQKGRFVALADLSYVDLSASRDVAVRDPLVLNAELDTSLVISTVAAGYRAVDQERLSLDAFGGVRIMSVDTRVSLSFAAAGITRKTSETWVDPVLGLRLRAPLAERWTMVAYGDVGGFGVGSDVTWQLLGGVQYELGRKTSVALGWRHYVVDYESEAFIYDVSLTGPVIGFTVTF